MRPVVWLSADPLSAWRMNVMRIGFVGTGTITEAVVTGIVRAWSRIIVSPRNAAVASRLMASFPVFAAARNNRSAAAAASRVQGRSRSWSQRRGERNGADANLPSIGQTVVIAGEKFGASQIMGSRTTSSPSSRWSRRKPWRQKAALWPRRCLGFSTAEPAKRRNHLDLSQLDSCHVPSTTARRSRFLGETSTLPRFLEQDLG